MCVCTYTVMAESVGIPDFFPENEVFLPDIAITYVFL